VDWFSLPEEGVPAKRMRIRREILHQWNLSPVVERQLNFIERQTGLVVTARHPQGG
jgi:hypothetical protein